VVQNPSLHDRERRVRRMIKRKVCRHRHMCRVRPLSLWQSSRFPCVHESLQLAIALQQRERLPVQRRLAGIRVSGCGRMRVHSIPFSLSLVYYESKEMLCQFHRFAGRYQ
jgi:hypothetical protein